MVLEVSDDGKDIQVYSGVYMRLRLIQLLGITKAWRIVSLVYQSVKPLLPVQQRRTFLRYSGGLLAGLAVLGLKPMQAHAEYVLESPDSSTTARHLSGSELQNAVTEATGDTEYGPLRSYLLGRGYTEEQGQASGILVETTSLPSVLFVTVPFTHTATGGIAQVKYMRHDSQTDTVMGTFHNKNGQLASISAFEVVSGRVNHTQTFDFKDGTVVKRPPGTPPQSSTMTEDLSGDNEAHVNKCEMCINICRGVRSVGCARVIPLICPGLCLAFTGPAVPICTLICALMVAKICAQGIDESCEWICKYILKFCK